VFEVTLTNTFYPYNLPLYAYIIIMYPQQNKVPGLNSKLAKSIIAARPIASRADLLKVKGIGPVAYKNSAGFLQVIYNALTMISHSFAYIYMYEAKALNDIQTPPLYIHVYTHYFR
jgi:hypothetical protein